jgi:hypothetical protein
LVGVTVGVDVSDSVGVTVGVSVLVGVTVGVSVLVGVTVGVSVLVGVGVGVMDPKHSTQLGNGVDTVAISSTGFDPIAPVSV